MFGEEWYPFHGPKGTILSDPDRGLLILEENPVCKDTLQSASSHSPQTHTHTDIPQYVWTCSFLLLSHYRHAHILINAKKLHAMPDVPTEVPEISPKVQAVRKTPSLHKRSHQSLSPIENNRAASFRVPHHPQSLPIKITLTGALIEAEGNLLSSAITRCIFMVL